LDKSDCKEQSEFFIEKKNDIHINEQLHISSNYYPHKSLIYIRNRYVHHPSYHYDIYGIYSKEVLRSVFVLREVLVEGSRCLRIVDWIGQFEEIPDLRNEFQKLLVKRDAEYIDLMNYGIRSEVLNRIGFLKKDKNIIIPNNFEPFERKNATILLAFKTDRGKFTAFKGDSDQDRPNAGFYRPRN